MANLDDELARYQLLIQLDGVADEPSTTELLVMDSTVMIEPEVLRQLCVVSTDTSVRVDHTEFDDWSQSVSGHDRTRTCGLHGVNVAL